MCSSVNHKPPLGRPPTTQGHHHHHPTIIPLSRIFDTGFHSTSSAQLSAPKMATSIPANPTSNTVVQLLAKLGDNDPDFRFMALNDLLSVFANSKSDMLHHDYNTAARTIDSVVNALDDQNGEVQNQALKWSVAAVVFSPPPNHNPNADLNSISIVSGLLFPRVPTP